MHRMKHRIKFVPAEMRELIENARDLAGLDTTVRAALRISSTFRSQIEKKMC